MFFDIDWSTQYQFKGHYSAIWVLLSALQNLLGIERTVVTDVTGNRDKSFN